jgi:hypothetical protein
VLAVVFAVFKPAAFCSFSMLISGGPDFRQAQASLSTFSSFSVKSDLAGAGVASVSDMAAESRDVNQ